MQISAGMETSSSAQATYLGGKCLWKSHPSLQSSKGPIQSSELGVSITTGLLVWIFLNFSILSYHDHHGTQDNIHITSPPLALSPDLTHVNHGIPISVGIVLQPPDTLGHPSLSHSLGFSSSPPCVPLGDMWHFSLLFSALIFLQGVSGVPIWVWIHGSLH